MARDIHLTLKYLQTIFFGANDAATEGTLQHVPLEEYRRNLKRIIAHPLLAAHSPKMILIVPPPVCEYKMQEFNREMGRTILQRVANVTKKYADAAKEVAKEVGVTTVDLWSVFMAYTGWHEGEPYPGSLSQPRSEKLGELLRDGWFFHAYLGFPSAADEYKGSILLQRDMRSCTTR